MTELSKDYYLGMSHGETLIAHQIDAWADMGLTLEEILKQLREAGLL